jgi:hypothetical protein
LELRAPVTAETIAWDAPSPKITLVVKGTFQLRKGQLVASKALFPLEEFDRVPWKGAPELLVVGTTSEPMTVRVGNQVVNAVAGEPELSPPPAWLQRRLPPDLDYHAFNVAPRTQWLDALAPALDLHALGTTTSLPSEHPVAALRASLGAAPKDVPLFCDTLIVDVDEERVCLVWRAVVDRPGAGTFVISWKEDDATSPDDAPPTRPKPRPRAAAPTIDVSEAMVEQGARLPFRPAVGEAPMDTGSAEQPANSDVPLADGPPNTETMPPAPPPLPQDLPPHVTAALARAEGSSPRATLPEAAQSDEALPFASPSSPGPQTIVPPGPPSQPGDELPFKSNAPRPPSHPGSTPPGSARGTLGVGVRLADSALPFGSTSPSAPAPSPSQPAIPPPAPPFRAPLETLQDMEAVAAPPPAPTPPRPKLDISKLGSIRASLLDGEELREVLESHGVDERTWRDDDRALTRALAVEQEEGLDDLAHRLQEAIAAARRSEPAEMEVDIDTYVSVRAEVEEAMDGEQALEELGIPKARWTELRRSWTRRALADPGLADELRDKLAAERRKLRRLT